MPTPTPDTPDTPDAAEQTGTALPWWARNSTRPYLTPEQVRGRTKRGTAATLMLVAALLAGTWWVLTASEVKSVTTDPGTGALAYKQTTNALIGGCGPMYTFPDALDQSGTVPATDAQGNPNRQHYLPIVPGYGAFWNKPAPDGRTFYSRTASDIPVAENLLNNMWHGAMVVYYDHTVPDKDITTLRDLTLYHPELELIVVPWEEETRSALPKGRALAFATWNNTQSCHQLVPQALYDFRRLHPANAAPGHDGTPPPALAPVSTAADGSAAVVARR